MTAPVPELPPVCLIDDPAGLRPHIEAALPGVEVAENEVASAVGLLGWTNGSRAEIAAIDAIRDRHEGQLVAILETAPNVRGARALAAKLDGVIFCADL